MQNWKGMVSPLISDRSEQEMHQINFDLCECCHTFCCSCVIGIMTKLWAGWYGAHLPAGWRHFSLLQKCPETHPASFSVVLGVCSVWEWLGHNADHLSQSSATVDNEWSYSPTLLMCLHCTHQGALSLTSFSTHLTALSVWPYYWNIFRNKRPLHTMSCIYWHGFKCSCVCHHHA
jgi:hypothetical protein